mmetsp:Transcript_8755/g.16413  ORF Transcript_8755/g.16413 Transcript_8755/m.16413 type:complete len:216 (+) Transcript_8755:2599-3246(+)
MRPTLEKCALISSTVMSNGSLSTYTHRLDDALHSIFFFFFLFLFLFSGFSSVAAPLEVLLPSFNSFKNSEVSMDFSSLSPSPLAKLSSPSFSATTQPFVSVSHTCRIPSSLINSFSWSLMILFKAFRCDINSSLYMSELNVWPSAPIVDSTEEALDSSSAISCATFFSSATSDNGAQSFIPGPYIIVSPSISPSRSLCTISLERTGPFCVPLASK